MTRSGGTRGTAFPVLVVAACLLAGAAWSGERPALQSLIEQGTTSDRAPDCDARIERADVHAALRLRYRPLLLAQAKAHECGVSEADELDRFDAVMTMFADYLLRERLFTASELREAIAQRDMALRIAPFSGCDQAMRNMGGNGWIQAQAIRHRLVDLGLLSDETTTGP